MTTFSWKPAGNVAANAAAERQAQASEAERARRRDQRVRTGTSSRGAARPPR
jgi:hypothetical protein